MNVHLAMRAYAVKSMLTTVSGTHVKIMLHALILLVHMSALALVDLLEVDVKPK